MKGQPLFNLADPNEPRKVRVECYTRIVGYLRPKRSANPGKQQEIRDRLFYAVPFLTAPDVAT